jgi:outer membrane biosynthesis protein TonB
MAILKPIQTKHWLALIATLFVIVLIAHLAAIDAARGQFNITKSIQTTALTTRMVEIPTPTPVVQKVPEAVTPQKVVPKTVKPKVAPVIPPKSAPEPEPLPKPAETTAVVVADPVPPAPPPVTPPAPAPPAPAPPAEPPPAAVPEVATATPQTPLSTPAATSSSTDATQTPPAFTALNSGQHIYNVIATKSGNSTKGEAKLTWQQDAEKYALELSVSSFIEILNYKSAGTMSPQGLMPLDFYDKTGFKSTVAAHFVYPENKITFSTTPAETALLAGAQDRNSILIQIAGMLAASPSRYPPGTTFSIQIVSAREAEPWLFVVNEPETLNLESDSQIALRITRNPRREFDRKIELWFAPAMNYIPVRYRQTESNGDYLDLVWKKMQPLPNMLAR